jgi:hypothetical protein
VPERSLLPEALAVVGGQYDVGVEAVALFLESPEETAE